MVRTLKRINEFFNQSITFRDNRRLQKVIFVMVLFLTVYLLLAFVSMPARLDISVGRPSTRTIQAPRDTEDTHATEKKREEAAAGVADVYDYDPTVLENALSEIDSFFDSVVIIAEDDSFRDEIIDDLIEQLREEQLRKEELEELNEDIDPEEVEIEVEEEIEDDDNDIWEIDEEVVRAIKIEHLQELLPEHLPPETVSALLTTEGTLRDLQERLNNSIQEIFEEGIKEGEVEAARRRLNREIALYPSSANLKRVAEVLVRPLVDVNMHYNEEATMEARQEARDEVDPVIILRNTLIVTEGEPVTEHQLSQLEDLGLVIGQQIDYPAYLGLFLLLVIIFVLAGIYMSIFVKEVFVDPHLLLLMGLVFVITLVFIIATNFFSGYLIPVAIGVILITVLFGYKLALIFSIALVLMVGFITGGDFSFMIVALAGSLVSIYAVTRLSQRSDLARAGFYVALTNAVAIIATYLFFGNVSLEYDSLVNFSYSLMAGVGSGILSSIVAIGLLPYLENSFGVTTPITLLELSNPNHPLLREMLMKAPGTYYHSMMVSNLSETAAEAVGADSLLTRVGAYYHDIGKLKRPYFFSENQLAGDNPHNKLSPNLSVLVIGAHPKDGLETGKKHRLPEPILDMILQHHGTSMVSFFYQKALENNNHQEVIADKFRYEGPKPQTKEAAIVMLADGVEAGVRSISRPTSNRVETMVRRMFKEKLDDGQLDQSDLTLKELDKIVEAFVYILSGIYHQRIEYPEKILKAELERGNGAK